MIDSIKRFLGLYDSNGLKYSIEHLEKIREDIIFYPIKKQAKYVDQSIKKMVDKEADLTLIGLFHVDLNDIRVYNNTSIGKIAYIILNSWNTTEKNRASEILEFAKTMKK